MKLQPYIQDKLLKKIDGNRPPRNPHEAYDQVADIEHKNQITSRYGMSPQIYQISEYDKDEEYKGIEVMEGWKQIYNKYGGWSTKKLQPNKSREFQQSQKT